MEGAVIDAVFLACNNAIIPFWILLLVAPAWRWTERLVHSGLAPALLAVVYVIVFVTGVPGPEGGGFHSMDAVFSLFTERQLVLVAWIHIIAFDLFVGAWEARDAHRRGISRLAMAPVLILTLLFGPAGLLAYLVLRKLLGKEPEELGDPGEVG